MVNPHRFNGVIFKVFVITEIGLSYFGLSGING